ncbi:NAD kinase [Pycnococcus provasolii]
MGPCFTPPRCSRTTRRCRRYCRSPREASDFSPRSRPTRSRIRSAVYSANLLETRRRYTARCTAANGVGGSLQAVREIGAAPPRVTNVLNEVAVMNVVGGSGMSIEVPRTPPIGDFAAAWRSGLASLFLHVDDQYVACMRGDGLLVATGTGSTAYALAAGGPCVSPSVPCTLVVPVSPHTLSCRPLVLPELATIRVEVGEGGGARAVLDGRHAVPLSTGDALVVEPTVHHLPVLTQRRHDGDWYGALTDKLGWSLT